MGPQASVEHSLPAVHTLHLAELVARWDVSTEALLAGTGLTREVLTDPEARVSIATAERLVARARALTGEPGLGFYLGLQMRASAHGYLGFAAMTSSTLGQAVELATRFAPTRTTALGLRLHVAGGVAALVLDEHASLGTARDVIVFALLVGIGAIGRALTGRPLEGSVEVAFDEPEYFARFAHALAPVAVRFGQPAHRLVFDAAHLELPVAMADPAALRLAREQCERELDALGYDGHPAARVRALVEQRDGGFRSLAQVAAEMHVSARTLKRRLAEQGTDFSTLLEEARRERALLLLRASGLSLKAVAERVGYSDVANFTRAFRRWTGVTPGELRRKAAAPARGKSDKGKKDRGRS